MFNKSRRSILLSMLTMTAMGCSSPLVAINTNDRLRRYYIFLQTAIIRDTGVSLRDIINARIDDGFREFYIIIASPGGSADGGIGIYNFLMSLRNRGDISVITHNVSRVFSAAVDIFMAGQTRLMNTNASFLLHSTIFTHKAPQNADDLTREYMELRQNNDISAAIIRSHTKMPEYLIDEYEYNHLDHIITADDALKFGFVDRVVDLTVPIDSEVTSLVEKNSAEDKLNRPIAEFKVGPEILVEFHKPKPPSFLIINGPTIREEIYVP